MRFRTQVGCWAAAAVCAAPAALTPDAAHGQGFGLNEIGSCAIGRGFATTGAPCDDASTLYWNPAAITTLRGFGVYVGGSAIRVGGRFTADSTLRVDEGDIPIEFPPFLGLTWKGSGARTSRLALGVAAYVPYGLTSQWREDFPGRFSAQRASLQTIYVQPTIAFDVVPGRFSIGAGAIWGHSALELRQGIDLAEQRVPVPNVPVAQQPTFARFGIAPGTEFARAELEGDGTAVGAHVGAFLRVSDRLTIGARYLTSLKFEYEGEANFRPIATGLTFAGGNPLNLPAGTPVDAVVAAQFQQGGALVAQGVRTEIEHPGQIQVGVGYRLSPATLLSADYARIQWNVFQALPVDFQGPAPDSEILEEYGNSDSFRAGLEHRFGTAPNAMRSPFDGVTARLGFSFATTPAPDQTVTPLLPDMDRYDYSGGLGIPLGRRFALDAAYLYVDTKGRRGRIAERPEGATAAQAISLNSGFYELDAHVFSLSLKATF